MNRLSLPIAVLACALAACTAKPKPEQEAVFGAIRENLDAMQREDLNGVMATVHPQTPDFEASKAIIEEIFKKYDLKFELSNLKLVSLKDGEAKVAYTQKTMRVGGEADLPDNMVEGVHTLKKDGDKWKITNSVQLRVTPLSPK